MRRVLARRGETLPPTKSLLVQRVEQLLDDAGLWPPPASEYEFATPRKFAFDYAWPELGIAIEVEGIVHRTAERFETDAEKYFLAALNGWRVFRFTPGLVSSGRANELLGMLAIEIRERQR